MGADIIMPDSDGRFFSLIGSMGWEIPLVLILIFSLIYGSWKLYKDIIIVPAIFKQALQRPPLCELEKHGFVFDGDYFKSTTSGYLILITFHWIDYFNPKGNYMVGVLFDHQDKSQVERVQLGERLEEKYREHEPPIIFYENFAYQLFPENSERSTRINDLLQFKDLLIRIVSLENLPEFAPETIEQVLNQPVKSVFEELEGLV